MAGTGSAGAGFGWTCGAETVVTMGASACGGGVVAVCFWSGDSHAVSNSRHAEKSGNTRRQPVLITPRGSVDDPMGSFAANLAASYTARIRRSILRNAYDKGGALPRKQQLLCFDARG